ncbi:hypothetical protein LTS18_003891, partial [Coniosporium uncinatum]
MWAPGRSSRTSSTNPSVTVPNASAAIHPPSVRDHKGGLTVAMWQPPPQPKSRLDYISRTSTMTSSTLIDFSDVVEIPNVEDPNVAGDEHQWFTSKALSASQSNTAPRSLHSELSRSRRHSMSSNQTNSTLAEQEQEMELKTLITAYIQVDAPQPAANEATDIILDLAPVNTASATGPLETQLLSLLTSIRSVEHSRPTIMAIDYARLQDRITVLEAETQGLQVRYHALQALRVNGLSNLLCIRDQLAASRHETTTI